MNRRFQRKNQRLDKKRELKAYLHHKTSSEEDKTDCSLSDSPTHLPYEFHHVAEEILFLGKRYMAQKQTIYLAIAYLGIYQNTNIKWYSCNDLITVLQDVKESSKKIGLALFAISSKLNDIDFVTIEQLTRCYGEAFKESIVILEHRILEVLNFQIPQQTPFSIFYQFYRDSQQMMEKCFNLFEKSILALETRDLQWQLLAKATVQVYSPQTWQNQQTSYKILIKTTGALLKKQIS